jgi:hypothetical protein
VPKKAAAKKDKEKKGGEKATFAKRYRPTSKQSHAKYDMVRDVYNVSLRKYLTSHTWCEDTMGFNMQFHGIRKRFTHA